MRLNAGWTKEQLEYMMEHYPFERTIDIAEKIGKTKSSIDHKANRLGLSKDPESLFKIKSDSRKGNKTWNFKGYRRRTSKGYIRVYRPEHPLADRNGLVPEHRLVMEEALGFIIPKKFDIHHINGIKDDNRIENLTLMTHSAHSILHNKLDGKQKSGERHPRYIKIDVEEAKRMRNGGASIKQLCEHFGVGETKIYSELRRTS